MTHEELKQVLEGLPLRQLHKLAQGKIHRHFRLGKRRLIELLLSLPPEARMALGTLAQEQEMYAEPKKHIQPKTSRPQSPTRRKKNKVSPDNARSHPPVSVEALLQGLGVPPQEDFAPDPWQEEAVSQLARTDVIVSVPTGSGKTYVAIEATKRALEEERTVIYTSPLKALSNTKFMEFSQLFGEE